MLMTIDDVNHDIWNKAEKSKKYIELLYASLDQCRNGGENNNLFRPNSMRSED